MATRKPSKARVERARLILKGIKRLLERVTTDSHRVGTQLTKLHDLRLYEDLGYKNFNAMVRGELPMSAASARKLIAVSRAYTPEQFQDLGVEKAYALVTYVNATPEDDVAAMLLEADAKIAGKPISEHSTRDLKTAIKEVHYETGKQPRETRATANRVVRAVEQALEHRGATDFRVGTRIEAGQWVVNIRLTLDEALLIAK